MCNWRVARRAKALQRTTAAAMLQEESNRGSRMAGKGTWRIRHGACVTLLA